MKKESDLDYEIAIIGGGPAGISTWLHLNKYNPELAKKTILIEKEKYPREKICGGGIGGWSEYVLKKIGYKFDFPTLNVSEVEFIYRNKNFKLEQPNSFRMAHRLLFDNSLLNFAKEKGLKIKEEQKLVDFKNCNNKLKIITNKEKIQSKVLIGADGALSTVRKKMDKPVKIHLSPTIEIFTPENSTKDSEYKNKKITIDLNPIDNNIQGYIWHVPILKEETSSIGHGIVNMNVIKNEKKGNLKEVLQKKLKSRDVDINKYRILSHPIPWSERNQKLSQPNILLTGDAAGVEPAFGGGIHFALSYGQITAKTLIDAYEINDFSFTNYEKDIENHFMGKFLNKCHKIANQLYRREIEPFTAAKEVFTLPK